MPPQTDQSAKRPEVAEDIGAVLREMFRVALPAVVTMLSYTAMQFVDMVIVSQVSHEAVAAIGNGGVAAFVPAAAMFGLLSVVATYVSQNLGAGTPEKGAAYAWNAMYLIVGVWAVAILPFGIYMGEMMHAVRDLLGVEQVNASTAALEVAYGRVLCFGMAFTIGARGMSHYFYGVHRANIVMVAAIIANLINVPLTWALVMGKLGLPQMGAAGAAWGTVTASLIELTILLLTFLSPSFNNAFKTRCAWRPSLAPIKDILRIGWPPALMFANEITCWWLFMAGLIATFGTAHNAAGWIALRYMHISFMPAVGLSMAVTAVVGKCIGADRRDLVVKRTLLGLSIAVGYMGACALLMVLFREQLVGVFADPEYLRSWLTKVFGTDFGLEPLTVPADTDIANLIDIGAKVLILAATFQIFDACAITLVAALRGAGDTIWPGVATAVLSWTFLVGFGFLLIRTRPDLGSLGPWIGASAFIITLAIALAWRFWSGKWKRIDLLGARDRGEEQLGAMREPSVAVDAGEGLIPELPAIALPRTPPRAPEPSSDPATDARD